MASERLSAVYPLNAKSIDEIAAQIEEYLNDLGYERSNILRIRLGMEEALLRWRDRFGDGPSVRFMTESNWFRNGITLQLDGESCDPFASTEDDFGAWAGSLLGSVGIEPHYVYRQRSNIIQLRLKKVDRNPALRLLSFLVFGVALAGVSEALLSPELRSSILLTVLDPIQNAFFRVLNAASGPLIFLTLLNAICGVGHVTAAGLNGRRMLERLLLLNVFVALVAMLIAIPIFRLGFDEFLPDSEQVSSVLDLFLHFIPNDLLSPFVDGDSPQIILVALILGYALINAGSQAGGLISLVDQTNAVGLIVVNWVNRLSPYFIVMLLVLNIWENSIRSLLGIWIPLLTALGISLIPLSVALAIVCRTQKIALPKLLKKVWPSFLLAMKSASVDASYGANERCCERELGIQGRFLKRSLPLGLVLYMPAGIVTTIAVTFYAADTAGIHASLVWYLVAVFMAVALIVATPPVSGIGIVTYAAIFTRLDIPETALTIALIADILSAFFTSPLNQLMLQLELVMEADRSNNLNQQLLQK